MLPWKKNLQISTSTFEIGAFLSLGKTWRHLDGIRLLMGDETTRRTKEHLIKALQEATDDNIESVKEKDDSLYGLAAVRDAIRCELRTSVLRASGERKIVLLLMTTFR